MILKIGVYASGTTNRDWIYIDDIKEIKVCNNINELIPYEDFTCKDRQQSEDFVYKVFYLELFCNNGSKRIISISNIEKSYIINNEGKTIEKI